MTETTASFSVQGRIRQLGNALRAMAPHEDWGWILRGADRLRAKAVPAQDKRPRLQTPDRLADLGLGIVGGPNVSVGSKAGEPAADYLDGVIMALLAYR